jgi:exopolysaccharide biosynthesis polyprenyl glycosylphosphotransferase
VILVAGDVIVLASLTAAALQLGAVRSHWDWGDSFLAGNIGWMFLLTGLWMGLAWLNGLYDPRVALDGWSTAWGSVKVSAQVLLIWAIAYFVPPPWTLVRHVVVFFTFGAALAMPLWRQLYAGVFSRAAFRRRLLIVGAGVAGQTLLAALTEAARQDYEVLGFVDDDPAKVGGAVDGVDVVADRRGLVDAARRLAVTDLALAITHDLHGELLTVLMEAREQGLAVLPMPVLYEDLTGRVPVEHIGDHWEVALPLDAAEGRGVYRVLRRGGDVLLALLGGVVLLLVLLPVALFYRRESPGPVLYRQLRVGRGGRPFMLLKLRTMVDDAEPDGPVWARPDDPRVTRLGRWLRRTRLDELPQVVNILRGEMSVVGPRPERPEFVAELAQEIPFYRARHVVRPGLTGWASIHMGYAASAEEALEKLQYDLYYIKHQSPALDLYIMLRTVGVMLRLGGR